MNASATPPSAAALAEEFNAAVDWWRTAGVDHDYADDVTDWLAPPVTEPDRSSDKAPKAAMVRKASPATPPAPQAKKIGGAATEWPGELAAFQKWWLESDWYDVGSYPLIAPKGGTEPELMILVPEPEETDRDYLLSGPHGELLRNILRAADIGQEGVYFASVLRRHTPMPDWAELAKAGLGELLAHHIKLVKPRRIVTFGRNIPPLLGHDMAQGAAFLYKSAHGNGDINIFGAGSPAELLRTASRRQRFWRNWLDWMDD
ncbi:MAG: uracil-DNA glycosylase family protein [Pontixanthobacter sp.]